MTKQLTVKPEVEILLKARDRLEKGWCRRDFSKITGWWIFKRTKYCLLGAIDWSAEEKTTDQIKAMNLLAMQVNFCIPNSPLTIYPPEHSIWYFNDEIGCTKEEILAVVDRAIEYGLTMPDL